MTLIEVSLAMIILVTAGLVSARLSGTTLKMIAAARLQSSATVLAARKVEELRGGGWQVAGSAAPLSPSPPDALSANTAGFVEYFDAGGQSLGGGASPPPRAVFICRWLVDVHPWNPPDLRVIRVLATPVVRDTHAGRGVARRRHADESLVTTLVTRKVQ